jgi:ABC-2 type transport system ATP-binding protein
MGLDPVARRGLWLLIREHVERFSTSIILTTHHMDEAQYLSDEIMILSEGEIVA